MTALDIDTVRAEVRPSPVFWVVAVVFAGGVWAAATRAIRGDIAVFITVAAGWLLSLIFHEFAHAYVAWRGGDRSVAARGYLTLDPRRYTNPLLSFGLPLLLVAMGGIGLPGGMVWIDQSALRTRRIRSAVSLAGPAANAAFAVACVVPLAAGWVDGAPILLRALSFLAFLQVTAVILNLLPIPGLDGFGALEPYLPGTALRAVAPARQYGMLALFVGLWMVDSVQRVFWHSVLTVVDSLGVDAQMVADGFVLFRFWDQGLS